VEVWISPNDTATNDIATAFERPSAAIEPQLTQYCNSVGAGDVNGWVVNARAWFGAARPFIRLLTDALRAGTPFRRDIRLAGPSG
jgi:hypothetical protein